MEKDNNFASKFKPEYCDQLIRHLKNGKSFSCFNVDPPVFQSTIFNWYDNHPEFKMAREIGEKSWQLFLESLAYYKVTGIKSPELDKLGSKKIDGEMLRFLLARKFRKDYSERTEVEHSGKVAHTIIFEEVLGDGSPAQVPSEGRPEPLPVSSNGTKS